MNQRERVEATLRGSERDRPPVSFWRHFYEKEDSASGLAEAMLAFQGKYDWDFMKVNPRASYHGEGWGLKVRFRGEEGLKPERIDYPIKDPLDWGKVKSLPLDEGALAEQIQALRLIRKGLGQEIPMVQTLFTPLSIAGDLVGTADQLLQDLKYHPDLVHQALQEIAVTFARYAQACLQAGADGVFLATTEWASYNLLSDELYREFGRPYDLQVLAGAREGSFNILHVCESRNMLKALLDYPVHAFSWAATDPTNPSLQEILERSEKAVIGGIEQEKTLRQGSREDLRRQIQKAKEEGRRGRWMLGPGCAIPVDVPEAHLEIVRQDIEKS
jgi:uroporphyrinogen decarboxylase